MEAIFSLIILFCVAYCIIFISLIIAGIYNKIKGKKTFGNILLTIGLFMLISVIILITIGASYCGGFK